MKEGRTQINHLATQWYQDVRAVPSESDSEDEAETSLINHTTEINHHWMCSLVYISRVNHLWRNLEVNFHLFHHLPEAINTHKQTLSCWSIMWQNVPVHVTALVVSIYSLYTMYNVTDTLYDDQPEQTVETVLFNTKRWTCLKSQSLQIHFLCEIFNVHVHILLGIPNDGW